MRSSRAAWQVRAPDYPPSRPGLIVVPIAEQQADHDRINAWMGMLRSRPVVPAQFLGHGTLLVPRSVSRRRDHKVIAAQHEFERQTRKCQAVRYRAFDPKKIAIRPGNLSL